MTAFREEIIGPCRLILADCLEVLPTLGKVDAIVIDPPYGIGAGNMNLGMWRTSRMENSDWDNETPCLDGLLSLGVPMVVWGGNYFPLPPSRKWLVWNKGAGFKDRDFAECEMAWCSEDGNARVLDRDPLAKGDYRNKVHPTQKPLAVMEWSLSQVAGDLILDSFMGSGTTGIACINAERRFIGIEKEEKYFTIACDRIQRAWDLKCSELPFDKPAKLTQRSLMEVV